MELEAGLRQALCKAGRRLWARGLIGACEGNLSVRLGEERLLVTPAGVNKGDLGPEDLVLTDLEGRPQDSKTPTSEIGLHLCAYAARPDCNAVVHAHPIVATSMTIAGEEIPDDVMPEAGYVLGPVAHVEFAYPGTDEVRNSMARHLADHKTFLLSHHGAMTMGHSIDDACDRMETLERVATVLTTAKALGRIRPMPAAAFEKMVQVSLNGRL